jgi:hypothetical protein
MSERERFLHLGDRAINMRHIAAITHTPKQLSIQLSNGTEITEVCENLSEGTMQEIQAIFGREVSKVSSSKPVSPVTSDRDAGAPFPNPTYEA